MMADAINNLKGRIGGSGSGGTGSTGGYTDTIATTYLDVLTPDQAATKVTELITKLLKRQATDADIKYWAPKLIAAEKKNPARQTTSTDAMGNSVVNRVKGLNENVWFETALKKSKTYKSEFDEVQKRFNNQQAQTIQAIAADNGIKPSDIQLKSWIDRVNAGEDINIIKSDIRTLASFGQPETVKKLLGQGVNLNTVYSPYKEAMAQTLELTPDAIKLDDPVLRSAIRPEGEMSIYDFQRALRKDPRWQYTDNARTEVANSVKGVLKDFGFMG